MKVLFMGRKETAAQALRWTVQQGHEVLGVCTDSHLSGSPTTAVARELGLPLWSLEDVYDQVRAQSLDIDLAVSVVFWRILRRPLIGAPSRGIVNFHPAPLPDFKGTAGYNLAILEGLDRWAVTAHYVDEGVDTGPIIDVFDFSIDPVEETAVSLESTTRRFMLALFKKTVRRIADSDEPQLPTTPNVGGRHVSRAEMEVMKRVAPGDDIDRKIRAFWFPPYRGASIEVNGREFTIVNDAILERLAPPNATNLTHSAGVRPNTGGASATAR